MKIISHRRNTLSELAATPTCYGVEVDIRSYGEKLVIHHDAMQPGDSFEEWIANYRHGTLILNVKEEGIEEPILKLLSMHRITDFFFLDQSFPFLVKWANRGMHQSAVRVSEYESVDTALSLAGKVEWIWVDCFTKFPLLDHQAKSLSDAGFKLCLVSPELQGRDAVAGILELREILQSSAIVVDAVCTKRPDLWEKK